MEISSELSDSIKRVSIYSYFQHGCLSQLELGLASQNINLISK